MVHLIRMHKCINYLCRAYDPCLSVYMCSEHLTDLELCSIEKYPLTVLHNKRRRFYSST